ncbi:hypothetical protein L2E82_36145 [Cichorium intybus]|uniref:Uncharacterized protein n=1 Tax=Cichorium intybus TaxID=13427 RepID=A0ACB9BR11_CICIN|nr:hypothetical protein L2E82_36145 [Cichorium intybus]
MTSDDNRRQRAPEEAKLERNVRSISLCSGKTPLNVRPLDKTNRGFLKGDNLTTRCFQVVSLYRVVLGLNEL